MQWIAMTCRAQASLTRADILWRSIRQESVVVTFCDAAALPVGQAVAILWAMSSAMRR